MQIQVITFRIEGIAPEKFKHYSDTWELGLRDMPGLLNTVCLEQQDANIHGGVCIWEDAQALAAFRHSELYARLACSPVIEDFQDKDMCVVPQTDLELALVA